MTFGDKKTQFIHKLDLTIDTFKPRRLASLIALSGTADGKMHQQMRLRFYSIASRMPRIKF